ncbi:hypothetical protein NUACC21_00750 [Scytonema sp. NUACC21]
MMNNAERAAFALKGKNLVKLGTYCSSARGVKTDYRRFSRADRQESLVISQESLVRKVWTLGTINCELLTLTKNLFVKS